MGDKGLEEVPEGMCWTFLYFDRLLLLLFYGPSDVATVIARSS